MLNSDSFPFPEFHDVRSLQRDHVRLHGIDCTADEWKQIEAIPAELFPEHGRCCAHLLGYEGTFPELSLLCFGAGCDFTGMPSFLNVGEMVGTWLIRNRFGVSRFEKHTPVRNAIFHELTHGFFHLAGGGFCFPRPLEEGYALALDYCLSDILDPYSGWGWVFAGRGIHGSLLPKQMMTIWDALTQWKAVPKSGNRYKNCELLHRLIVAGLWLVLWLTERSKRHPECGQVLAILRERKATVSQDIYDVLQEVTQLQGVEMERAYCEFAMSNEPRVYIRESRLVV